MALRRGVEFVDLATGENYQNHWVRSGCLLGNLPCNGLLYVAPHSCGCYIEAKLTGFNGWPRPRPDWTHRGKTKPIGDWRRARLTASTTKALHLPIEPTGRCSGTTRGAAVLWTSRWERN